MDNGSIFANRLKQLGIDRQVDAAVVVARSQEVINKRFGSRGSENLRVVSFRKGVLKIASSSSSWSAECRGITTKLQQSPVEKVVFVIDNLPEEEI